jgi:hypothetical protein
MKLKPNKLYKESMKQKFGALERLKYQQTLSPHDKIGMGEDPN